MQRPPVIRHSTQQYLKQSVRTSRFALTITVDCIVTCKNKSHASLMSNLHGTFHSCQVQLSCPDGQRSLAGLELASAEAPQHEETARQGAQCLNRARSSHHRDDVWTFLPCREGVHLAEMMYTFSAWKKCPYVIEMLQRPSMTCGHMHAATCAAALAAARASACLMSTFGKVVSIALNAVTTIRVCCSSLVIQLNTGSPSS
jgi:hypothetical protein